MKPKLFYVRDRGTILFAKMIVYMSQCYPDLPHHWPMWGIGRGLDQKTPKRVGDLKLLEFIFPSPGYGDLVGTGAPEPQGQRGQLPPLPIQSGGSAGATVCPFW